MTDEHKEPVSDPVPVETPPVAESPPRTPTLQKQLREVYNELPQAVIKRLAESMASDGFSKLEHVHDAETHLAAWGSLQRAIEDEITRSLDTSGAFWGRVRERGASMADKAERHHYRRAFSVEAGISPGSVITHILNS